MARRDIPKQRIRKILFELEVLLKQEEQVEASGFSQKKKQSSMDRSQMLTYTASIVREARRLLETGNTKRASLYIGWAASNLSTCAVKTIEELHEFFDQ